MSATTTSHARRTAERERVEEACRALLSSDGWRRWVRARSAFHSYSLNNQLLIVLQSPNATRVAGFHTWRKLGRQVRKGEREHPHPRAPPHPRVRPQRERHADQPGRRGQERAAKQLIGYRSVGVFDLSQTDPIPGADPLPLEPPSAPISGDSHAHLRPALVEHAASLGYTVSYEATDGCDGYCDRANRRGCGSSLSTTERKRLHSIAHTCGPLADWRLVVLATQTPLTRTRPAPHASRTCVIMPSG